MQDTLRFQGMRRRMVEKLIEKGIRSSAVLQALNTVPRHFFVPKGLEHLAYNNQALQIGAAQTISQPYMVAYQSELLELKAGEKVLEIGTGSGYQAAILAALGVEVYTIERIEELYLKTNQLFADIGYHQINMTYGDGFAGWTAHAPFDKMIVTAAAESLPHSLISQLKIGGLIVIPIGKEKEIQELFLYKRINERQVKGYSLEKCRFVPMLKGKK